MTKKRKLVVDYSQQSLKNAKEVFWCFQKLGKKIKKKIYTDLKNKPLGIGYGFVQQHFLFN
jgi:hypothetical protein